MSISTKHADWCLRSNAVLVSRVQDDSGKAGTGVSDRGVVRLKNSSRRGRSPFARLFAKKDKDKTAGPADPANAAAIAAGGASIEAEPFIAVTAVAEPLTDRRRTTGGVDPPATAPGAGSDHRMSLTSQTSVQSAPADVRKRSGMAVVFLTWA